MDEQAFKQRREAVGYVAEMSAFLEYTLVLLIGTLLDDKVVGRTLCSGRAAGYAISLARRIAPLRLDEDSQVEIRNALNAAESALRTRNDIIHSMWGAGQRPGEEWSHNIWEAAPVGLHEQLGMDQPVDFQSRPISLEEIEQAAGALDVAVERIRKAVPLLDTQLLA